MTGLVERSPRREQNGALAVVDYVSGRALFPPHGTGGADLPPHVIEVGPNLIGRSRKAAGGKQPCVTSRLHKCTPAARILPRRKRNRPVMSDCRALDLGSGAPPRRALGGGTGGASLLCRAAVLLQFGLTARQPASNRVGQGSKGLPVAVVLHANSMEPTDARYRRKDFTTEGKDHARRR